MCVQTLWNHHHTQPIAHATGGFGDDKDEGMHWIDLKVPMFELTPEDQEIILKVCHSCAP